MGLLNHNHFDPFLPTVYLNMLHSIDNEVSDQFAPDLFIKLYNAQVGKTPNSPNLKKALEGPYHEEFVESTKKEIQQLQV